jgi:hypothetical protein
MRPHTDWQNASDIGGSTVAPPKFPLAKFSELCLLNITTKQQHGIRSRRLRGLRKWEKET